MSNGNSVWDTAELRYLTEASYRLDIAARAAAGSLFAKAVLSTVEGRAKAARKYLTEDLYRREIAAQAASGSKFAASVIATAKDISCIKNGPQL